MKQLFLFFMCCFFAQLSYAQTAKKMQSKETTFSKTVWSQDGLQLAAKSDALDYYFDISNGNLQGVKVLDKDGNEVPSTYTIKAKGKGKSTKPILVEICTDRPGPNGTTIYTCKLVKQV